jgi:hypothetical protein
MPADQGFSPEFIAPGTPATGRRGLFDPTDVT